MSARNNEMTERKIVAYKIFVDDSVQKLEKQLIFSSKEGYILHGSPYETDHPDEGWKICQAMVKY
jgi:hypothetical protein